jgi:importin subunit beta-1
VQAIEFWSVLAEIELLLKEDEEINGVTSSTESECKRFLERCSEELVPKLLELLLLQNEEQDDEDTEWCAPFLYCTVMHGQVAEMYCCFG